jgi:hypothetical protein
MKPLRFRDKFASVFDSADNLKIFFQHETETVANDGVVIGQEDSVAFHEVSLARLKREC